MQTDVTIQTLVNPNKALWEKGDFTRIAKTMRKSGDALVAELDISKDHWVLDLGCGDGTTAVPAARRGAQVIGVDIASNLVAAGNLRARQEGLSNLSFHEGDASDLSELRDQTFDRVISIFGAMFGFRPFDVAREMVRVTKPGGKIIMGNWIPGDPTLVAQILRVSSAFTPPPPQGFLSPMLWGVEDQVVERFGAAGIPGEQISFERASYTFEYEGTPSELVKLFELYYGPTMNAFDAAHKNGKANDLRNELEALFKAQNQASHPDQTVITATYLRVTVLV